MSQNEERPLTIKWYDGGSITVANGEFNVSLHCEGDDIVVFSGDGLAYGHRDSLSITVKREPEEEVEVSDDAERK